MRDEQQCHKGMANGFTVMSIMQQELDPNKSIEAHPCILHFREKAIFFPLGLHV